MIDRHQKKNKSKLFQPAQIIYPSKTKKDINTTDLTSSKKDFSIFDGKFDKMNQAQSEVIG